MVGDILRQVREKQGLTIADVAEETSIRDIYLEAIEKGNYDALPGDVYAKGFIRNYSKFLQIDGDALLAEFDSERNIIKAVQPVDMPEVKAVQKPHRSFFGSKKAKESAAEKIVEKPQPREQKTNLFASGDDYRNRLEREEKSGSKKFMILLSVMLVFVGGVYIAFMDDETEAPKPAVKIEQTAVPAAQPVKTYDGVEIFAKFLENCWISVKVDGQVAFEGTVEKGKEMTWQGKESVDIVAGNAGGIEITYNGKLAGVLGQKGQIAEKNFTKQTDIAEVKPAAQTEASASSMPEPAAPVYSEPEPQPQPVQQLAPEQAPAPAAEPAPAAQTEAPAEQAPAEPAPAETAPSVQN